MRPPSSAVNCSALTRAIDQTTEMKKGKEDGGTLTTENRENREREEHREEKLSHQMKEKQQMLTDTEINKEKRRTWVGKRNHREHGGRRTRRREAV